MNRLHTVCLNEDFELIDRRAWEVGVQGTSAGILVLAACISSAALAVETMEYQIPVDDMGSIKKAVVDILPSIRLERLWIPVARAGQTTHQIVYVCGLISGFDDDASRVFFVERKGDEYIGRAVDMNIQVPGAAKAACDAYGIATPAPGFPNYQNAPPKHISDPPISLQLEEPLHPGKF